jgi:DNA-3-methyladenine glycosylase
VRPGEERGAAASGGPGDALVAAGPALTRDAFDRPVLDVAPALLGCVLVHRTPQGVVAVRLSEVEAYSGEGLDPGSHAHRGPTRRNAVMFGPAGHLYVYFTYGMHWCANLVCGPPGRASGVLLRAGEVVLGWELARSRRPAARADRDLARGPARLAASLGLTGAQNGADVCAGPGLAVLARPPSGGSGVVVAAHASGPRVGVGGDGAHLPWRFWLRDDATVSAYRPAAPRRRSGTGSGRLGAVGRAPSAPAPLHHRDEGSPTP